MRRYCLRTIIEPCWCSLWQICWLQLFAMFWSRRLDMCWSQRLTRFWLHSFNMCDCKNCLFVDARKLSDCNGLVFVITWIEYWLITVVDYARLQWLSTCGLRSFNMCWLQVLNKLDYLWISTGCCAINRRFSFNCHWTGI